MPSGAMLMTTTEPWMSVEDRRPFSADKRALERAAETEPTATVTQFLIPPDAEDEAT